MEGSKISTNPVKIIQGYYIAPDSSSGLSTQDLAKQLAESFKDDEVMFDIMLHTTMQARICGQMYKGGDYGGFWFIAHYGATYFYKNNVTWGKRICKGSDPKYLAWACVKRPHIAKNGGKR